MLFADLLKLIDKTVIICIKRKKFHQPTYQWPCVHSANLYVAWVVAWSFQELIYLTNSDKGDNGLCFLLLRAFKISSLLLHELIERRFITWTKISSCFSWASWITSSRRLWSITFVFFIPQSMISTAELSVSWDLRYKVCLDHHDLNLDLKWLTWLYHLLNLKLDFPACCPLPWADLKQTLLFHHLPPYLRNLLILSLSWSWQVSSKISCVLLKRIFIQGFHDLFIHEIIIFIKLLKAFNKTIGMLATVLN